MSVALLGHVRGVLPLAFGGFRIFLFIQSFAPVSDGATAAHRVRPRLPGRP